MPGEDNTAPMPMLTDMLHEAWEYLQDAKTAGSEGDIATWLEAIDVLLDSPLLKRAPL